jgi:hypothetical protein
MISKSVPPHRGSGDAIQHSTYSTALLNSGDLVGKPGVCRFVSGSARSSQDQCCSPISQRPLFNRAIGTILNGADLVRVFFGKLE